MKRWLVAIGIALYILAFSLFLWFYFGLLLLHGEFSNVFWLLFVVPGVIGLAGLIAFIVGLRT